MQEKEILESDILQSNNVNNNNINNNIIENSPLDNSADSIISYYILNEALNDRHKDEMELLKPPFSQGVEKKVILNEFKHIDNVKNNKVVTFIKLEKNLTTNPEKYTFKIQEAIFYAFLQVLDGNSPKFVSPSSQTYMGKDLIDEVCSHIKNNKLDKELDKDKYLLYIFLLYSLMDEHNILIYNNKTYIDYILNVVLKDCKDNLIKECQEIIKNYIKNTQNSIVNNPNCNSTININYNNLLNNLEHFKSVFKQIFSKFNTILYDANNKVLTKEQKKQIFDAFTQLFFLVLFTNKSDIKPQNALSYNNKITNIDPMVTNHNGFFHSNSIECGTLNQFLLSTSFDIIANEDNPAFEKYLKQYTLDEEKIKAIVRQATENLDRIEKQTIHSYDIIIIKYLKNFKQHLLNMKDFLKKEENIEKNELYKKLLEVLENNITQLDNFIKDSKIKSTVNYALTRQEDTKKYLQQQKKEKNNRNEVIILESDENENENKDNNKTIMDEYNINYINIHKECNIEDKDKTKTDKGEDIEDKDKTKTDKGEDENFEIEKKAINYALLKQRRNNNNKTKSSSWFSCPCLCCDTQEEKGQIIFEPQNGNINNNISSINNDKIKDSQIIS